MIITLAVVSTTVLALLTGTPLGTEFWAVFGGIGTIISAAVLFITTKFVSKGGHTEVIELVRQTNKELLENQTAANKEYIDAVRQGHDRERTIWISERDDLRARIDTLALRLTRTEDDARELRRKHEHALIELADVKTHNASLSVELNYLKRYETRPRSEPAPPTEPE